MQLLGHITFMAHSSHTPPTSLNIGVILSLVMGTGKGLLDSC